MGRIVLNLQDVCNRRECRKPGYPQFLRWIRGLNFLFRRRVEINLRLVDVAEMYRLNKVFRGRRHATDVLSFKFSPPPGIRSRTLGDVVMCCEVINDAVTCIENGQERSWARIAIHGVLHLAGFDHQNSDEASRMEQIEIRTLEYLCRSQPFDRG